MNLNIIECITYGPPIFSNGTITSSVFEALLETSPLQFIVYSEIASKLASCWCPLPIITVPWSG